MKKPVFQTILKNNEINMNTVVKTDSYSSALSIVHDGIAISILRRK